MSRLTDDRVAGALIGNMATFTTSEQLDMAREVVVGRLVVAASRHWVQGHDDAYREGVCPCKLCEALRDYDRLDQ